MQSPCQRALVTALREFPSFEHANDAAVDVFLDRRVIDREPIEEDADLALHALGFALQDIGWASWDFRLLGERADRCRPGNGLPPVARAPPPCPDIVPPMCDIFGRPLTDTSKAIFGFRTILGNERLACVSSWNSAGGLVHPRAPYEFIDIFSGHFETITMLRLCSQMTLTLSNLSMLLLKILASCCDP